MTDYWTIPDPHEDDNDGNNPQLSPDEQQELSEARFRALDNSTYGCFDELLDAVNDGAQACGFAIRKRRANNKDGETGLYNRYDLNVSGLVGIGQLDLGGLAQAGGYGGHGTAGVAAS